MPGEAWAMARSIRLTVVFFISHHDSMPAHNHARSVLLDMSEIITALSREQVRCHFFTPWRTFETEFSTDTDQCYMPPHRAAQALAERELPPFAPAESDVVQPDGLLLTTTGRSAIMNFIIRILRDHTRR